MGRLRHGRLFAKKPPCLEHDGSFLELCPSASGVQGSERYSGNPGNPGAPGQSGHSGGTLAAEQDAERSRLNPQYLGALLFGQYSFLIGFDDSPLVQRPTSYSRWLPA